MTKIVMVSTTVDGAAKAARLAEALVAERLAACVQQLPIRSVYRWKGCVEKAREYLLLAKTPARRAAALIRFIRANHPYELPEITVMPVTGGLPAYLQWVTAETRPGN